MNNKLRSLLPGWNLEPQDDGTIIVRKDGVMGYVAGAGPSIASNVLHELANDLLVALSASAEPAAQPVPPASGELQCWNCKADFTLAERAGCDGCCWKCGNEIDLDDYVTRLQAEAEQLQNQLRAWQALAAERLEMLTEPKPQGDQVNQVRSHGSVCWEDISGESLELVLEQPEEYEVRTLYRRPPAPVAVVLPARKTAEEYYTRLGNCNSARLAADEFNSALDEVARLNHGAKP